MSLDPRSIHDLDQQTGPLNRFAIILAAYYRSLVAEGFTRYEALQIVTNYQETLIRTLPRREDGR